MGYVYVKIFLGTPVHLGASENTWQNAPVNVGKHNEADAPRCVPTSRCISMRYKSHRKRVLITPQSGLFYNVISTCLPCNRHPFATMRTSDRKSTCTPAEYCHYQP